MTKAVVSTNLAKHVLKAVDAQGYDVKQLISTVGLPFNPLDPGDKDIPLTIPAELYNRLYTRVIWLLQDEAFGLHLKQPIPAGSFRMLCMCTLHCDSLESAIFRTCEFMGFCRNLSGLPNLEFNPLSIEGDMAISHIPSGPDLYAIDAQDNITGLAAYLHIWRRLMSWLISKPLPLRAVYLQCDAEHQRDKLESFFQCPVYFKHSSNALAFSKSFLAHPIHHTEESLKQFLKTAPYEMTMPSHDSSNDIMERMRAVVGNGFGKEFPPITEMAEQLNMSVRTLRRRLSEKQTSYQNFKDHTRMTAAMTYLNRQELKINTVAALMGFDEPSAFHRAFKKWTGNTPGEYRQQLNAH
jgi:AraC-like DNA-binding protein